MKTFITALADIEDVSPAGFSAWVGQAYEDQGAQLRVDAAEADEPRSLPSTEGARLCLRQYVDRLVDDFEWRNQGKSGRSRYNIDAAERKVEITNAIVDGLGWTRKDGQLVTPLNTDSYFLPGELTLKSNRLIWPNETMEMVRTSAEIKSVPSYVEEVDQDFATYSGKAGPYTPGQRTFLRADVGVRQRKTRLHWFHTSTVIPWEQVIYSSAPSALDIPTSKAKAARRALERLMEEILIKGVTGLDTKGLAQLGIPTIFSTVDFSTATLGAKVTEINRMLEKVRRASGYTVMPSVGWIDPRLTDVLSRSNNLDAGGSTSGAAPVLEAFRMKGVQRFVEAPTLETFLPSMRGSNYAQIVLWAPGIDGSLQHVLGMDIAPVSTAEYHGTETLWAFKSGLWELGNLSGAVVLDIKVS